ncbi:MAG TPA: OmpA family protein [Acetobacteraceae bacterium]|nr:OmpA family protein [Acetobacteraceae bacterium]
MRRRLLLIVPMFALFFATAAPAAEPRTFVLYFTSWSALIEQPADQIVAAAVAAANADPLVNITVTGYASTIGSVEANTLLARLRAQVVTDALVTAGVNRERIRLSATSPTTFVVEPVESRRTVIQIGTK